MLRCFAERIDLAKYRKQAPKHLAIKRGIDFVMEVPALQAGDVAADKRRLYDLTPDQKGVLEKTATMLRVPQGNLAAFWNDQDVTNAEFMRTFQSAVFPGAQLLQRLEDEMQRTSSRPIRKVLPAPPETGKAKEEEVVLKHFPDLYGYRGCLPHYKDVFYLNAWEFLKLWEIRLLPKPAHSQAELRGVPTSATSNATAWADQAPPLHRVSGFFAPTQTPDWFSQSGWS